MTADDMKHLLIAGFAASLLLAGCGGDAASTAVPLVSFNSAPTVLIKNTQQAAITGEAFHYDATQAGQTFADPDGDALTYTVSYEPSANGLSAKAGVISGTPMNEGVVTVSITADDGHGGSVSDNFQIIVDPAPVLTAVEARFGDRIDLANLENYAGQTVPAYITKLNDGGNPITDAGATLGRVLFYDPALSIDDTISCSSCHTQSAGFSDLRVVSEGVQGGLTERHSMRLINTQFANETNFFWDERASSLEEQESQPLLSEVEHGFSGVGGRPGLTDLITKLEAIDYYEELFTFVYGDAAITEERLQLALAQFTKSIWSFDSKFDEGRAQVNADNVDFPNFTADENAGKTLYFRAPANGGAGCQTCHTAPEFDISPVGRHNGVVSVANSPNEQDFTNTRSPTLRDMTNPDGVPNGPFMHDGSQPTLLDVVNHYDNIQVPTDAAIRQAFLNTIDPLLVDGETGQNLNLSERQKEQLIAFLNTLSGSNVYTDVKYSDPF